MKNIGKLNKNHSKGIIWRMKHFWEMYKLIVWVDNHSKQYDKNNPNDVKNGKFHIFTAPGIQQNYVDFSKKEDYKVRDIIASCIEEGFLQEGTRTGGASKYYYVNPARGRRFLRKWGKIPTGFLKEIFEDNHYIMSFIAGLFGGLVTLIIYLISTI